MKRYRFAKIIFLILVVAPLAIFVFGMIIMLLWNRVLVPVLHVSEITFWQGLGLLVLSKILFGSFGNRGTARGDEWRRKMMWKHMTPEQRERFKEEWRTRSRKWGYTPPESGGGEPLNPNATSS